ncbi:hypothetical protein GGX14DRAFT_492694 [Mycena pura]|uniref:Uncharacterized protein n=1 Tax=Mycena pura TaxID=153505 RepID=A0AAD6YJE5_9AGAR|nr:hypothetical protein GGX14DRAFT_492694 [Mycena pura]
MFRQTTTIVVFTSLSILALKLTVGNFIASAQPGEQKQCPTVLSSTPYRQEYTGLPSVDLALCEFVAFFHLALTPDARPLLSYFFGNALALLAIPAVEAFRPGCSTFLTIPVLFGLAAQVFTAGATFPIYWLAFILSGAAHRRPLAGTPSTAVSPAHAQAVVFGLAIGAVVPSMCLLVLQDPHVTALWQLFPLWQFLAQSAHLFVRRRAASPESGFSWIQGLYIAAFMISSSTHIATLAGSSDLRAVFLPSIAPRTNAPLELKVLDLFQWDFFFAFLSTLLGTVWFAKTTRQALCIVLWNVVGSVIVGPGAAVAAVALWREAYLHPESDDKKRK